MTLASVCRVPFVMELTGLPEWSIVMEYTGSMSEEHKAVFESAAKK